MASLPAGDQAVAGKPALGRFAAIALVRARRSPGTIDAPSRTATACTRVHPSTRSPTHGYADASQRTLARVSVDRGATTSRDERVRARRWRSGPAHVATEDFARVGVLRTTAAGRAAGAAPALRDADGSSYSRCTAERWPGVRRIRGGGKRPRRRVPPVFRRLLPLVLPEVAPEARQVGSFAPSIEEELSTSFPNRRARPSSARIPARLAPSAPMLRDQRSWQASDSLGQRILHRARLHRTPSRRLTLSGQRLATAIDEGLARGSDRATRVPDKNATDPHPREPSCGGTPSADHFEEHTIYYCLSANAARCQIDGVALLR